MSRSSREPGRNPAPTLPVSDETRLEAIRAIHGDDGFVALAKAVRESIEADDGSTEVFYGIEATHVLKHRHSSRGRGGRFTTEAEARAFRAAAPLGVQNQTLLPWKHGGHGNPLARKS